MACRELLTELLVPHGVGHEFEVEPAPFLGSAERPDEVLRCVTRLLPWLFPACKERVDAFELLREALIEHDEEELFLGLEVRVEGTLRITGILSHFLHRGSVEPLAAER